MFPPFSFVNRSSLIVTVFSLFLILVLMRLTLEKTRSTAADECGRVNKLIINFETIKGIHNFHLHFSLLTLNQNSIGSFEKV